MLSLFRYPASRPALQPNHQLVESFLLEEKLPPLHLLRRHRLAAFAYTQLAETHPQRAQLHADFVMGSMQHLKVRSLLKPLLTAWHDAGLEVMVFKDFFLAEFLYAQAAQRPYSDVDILIHVADISQLSRIAQALGWRETWRAGVASHQRSADSSLHEVLHLEHPEFPLRLDVHGRMVHHVRKDTRLQDRLTARAWEAAVKLPWEGSYVQIPKAADAFLFGLVMHRAWSADAWQLKAQDYLDAVVLAEHVSLDELYERARELGCARTLYLFLKRCNPYQKTLHLRKPVVAERLFWESFISTERSSPALERFLLLVAEATTDIVRAFPGVMLALGYRWHPEALQQRLAAQAVLHDKLYTWQYLRYKRGVQAYLLSVGLGQSNHLRTLALYACLRRAGHRVALEKQDDHYNLKLDSLRD